MFDIWSLFKKTKQKSAGEIAKERLKLVLIHDRVETSEDLLDKIRKDIMDVLSKYMEIDMDGLDIQISTVKSEENDGKESPALFANIPIKMLKKPIESLEKKDISVKVEVKKEELKTDDKKEEVKEEVEKETKEEAKEEIMEEVKEKVETKEEVKEKTNAAEAPIARAEKTVKTSSKSKKGGSKNKKQVKPEKAV